MKHGYNRIVLAMVTMVAATAWTMSALAMSMGLIGIKVEESNDKDRSTDRTSLNAPGYYQELSKTTTTTEKRSMTITISNRSPKPYENVTVKYWMFARDYQNRDGKVISSGKQTVSLEGLKSATIECKGATIRSSKTSNNNSRYSRYYNQRNTGRGSQKLGSDRTGLDYAGYGVVVIDSEGKIIAEDFTAGNMRELVANELPKDDNPWGLRKW